MNAPRQDATRRRGRVWALFTLAAGIPLVGATYGCVWYAIPDRPAACDWPIYGPLLFGPYALSSLACWRSPSRINRWLAASTIVAGTLILGVALNDTWPTFESGSPPAMPASVMVVSIMLIPQYLAAHVALLRGTSDRAVSLHRP